MIAGVVDTGDRQYSINKVKCTQLSSLPLEFPLLSPMSLTQLINVHSRISPRMFEKNRNGPIGILRGQGEFDEKKT